MQHIVEQHGLSNIQVDSAGTAGYHNGDRADSRMRAAAKRRGYELLSRARQVLRQDLDEFDLVIAMDQSNLRNLQNLNQAPRCQLKLLSDFLSDHWPVDVPDPYYGGADGFETVLDMIEAACPAILNELVS